MDRAGGAGVDSLLHIGFLVFAHILDAVGFPVLIHLKDLRLDAGTQTASDAGILINGCFHICNSSLF